MMTPTWPKAVLFDWDGTLVDSFNLIYEAHNFAHRNLDMLEIDVETFRPFFGKPREYIYKTLYNDKGAQAQKYFEKFVSEQHINHIKPIENIEQVLDFFKGHGVPMGIISNKRNDFIEAEIKHLGWGEYFFCCIGSHIAPQDKPDPAHALEGLKHIENVAPYETWYVGDTESDLEAGCAAGMQTFMITPKSPEDFATNYNTQAHFFSNTMEFHDFCVAMVSKPAKTKI